MSLRSCALRHGWLVTVAMCFAIPAHAQDNGARGFDAIMSVQNEIAEPGDPASLRPWDDDSTDASEAMVQVPLKAFFLMWHRVRQAAHQGAAKALPPAVVLGEAHYSGKAIEGALELNVRLGVTLGRPGTWKTVPLIGTDVVLVRASVGGQAVAVSTQEGYQVWVTQRTGEIAIELTILVPTRGPRGSIEYLFRVPRTPVTRFDCRFPIAGLEPRLDAAVESTVETVGDETVLTAIMRPTTQIHMIGFRDMGDSRSGKARVYVQTLNLLSVDASSLELFSVLRYTILYAGTKEFVIRVPRGVKVVSAAGRGAFQYTLTEDEQGTLLRGETAFPIRDKYEISLRLERDMNKGSETTFDVPLPTTLGVERETGWLAIEVPGKTRLDESRRVEMTAIDTRQLPPELVRSAVSPILRAYRYHDAAASSLRLLAKRLPEKETASESIDHVQAFTVLSTEGNVLTEVRFKLRNRLRNSIALDLPPGTRVRSVLLDGRPAKPSLDAAGRLILPLKRSSGAGLALKQINLQVVLESHVTQLDWMGRPRLALPAVDLPVSSLAWSVFLPANNLYSGLAGDIATQSAVGRSTWRKPTSRPNRDDDGDEQTTGRVAPPAGRETVSAYAGAMPVRITVPKAGTRLDYERFWLDSGQAATLSFNYLRRWLLYPLICGLGLLLMLGFWLQLRTGRAKWVGAALIVLPAWPLAKIGGMAVFLGFAAAGGVAFLLPHRWLREARASILHWARTIPARYQQAREVARALAEATRARAREATPTGENTETKPGRSHRRWFKPTALAVGMIVATAVVVEKLLALLQQLGTPLGG